ncbi:MAG: hypothetical protein EON58_17155 [Alphaproteobacteria bacterium]|nr:MAG: hypothetical protein EON58_17155 [Alphaproteobacteria bacterium]
MRRGIFFAFLVLATGARSQGPPPRKGEATKKPPQQTQSHASGPQASAPPITLAQIKALVQEENAKNLKKEELGSPLVDWWSRILGIVAAAVGVVQSYFIWRTLHLTKQSADAATTSAQLTKQALEDSEKSGAENLALTRQAAIAAEKSADAAIRSVEVAEKAAEEAKGTSDETLRLTRQSADAATKSAKTAEDGLVSIERPWIMFIRPEIVQMLKDAPDGRDFYGVVPRLKNVGRTPAFMLSASGRLYSQLEPPTSIRVFRDLFRKPIGSVLAPDGEYVMPTFTMGEPPRFDGLPIYLAVAVKYTDTYRKRHRSVSIWRYNFEIGMFEWMIPPGYHIHT